MYNGFSVIPGPVIQDILSNNRSNTIELVRETYLAHHRGQVVNPDSWFLRFPDAPHNRIIALLASIASPNWNGSGVKWIASFPENTSRNLQRASAVLVLNDSQTGYPYACLEASRISSARTAASAALIAKTIYGPRFSDSTVSFIGAGVIARAICEYFAAAGLKARQVLVHDIDPASAEHLVAFLGESLGVDAMRAKTQDDALQSDVVVFATTAGTPYISTGFQPGQLVLNISLRDICPEVILQSTNIVDDIEHCLKANTSPHLAEQKCGDRHFMSGTIADVLNGLQVGIDEKPVIVSPFGLGVLDLVVGMRIYEIAKAESRLIDIENFFGDVERW